MFARLGVFGGPFDLVVSGINPGANSGRAIYHSGTVGAALTARNGGVSGLAISQAVAGFGVEGQGWDEMLTDQHWDTAAEVGETGVAKAMLADLPDDPIVLNVNVPNRAARRPGRLAPHRGGAAPAPHPGVRRAHPEAGPRRRLRRADGLGRSRSSSRSTPTAARSRPGSSAVTALSRILDDREVDLGAIGTALDGVS